MTYSTPLSPAAQAVLDATAGTYGNYQFHARGQMIAAALRAAVNQASPEKQVEDIDYVHQSYVDGMRDALAVLEEIAAELDGTNNTSESD